MLIFAETELKLKHLYQTDIYVVNFVILLFNWKRQLFNFSSNWTLFYILNISSERLDYLVGYASVSITDTWLKCILSMTQELLFAARDEYARQINSYVQPYAVYELGCIFLAKSEVCLLHTTFILKLYKLALFDSNCMRSQAELCCFPYVGIQTVGKGRSLLLQAKVIFPCLLLLYIKHER